ncbi:Low affinity iron permease [Apiospora phragmitis]|uniref:Low affinity iron permease n=1 Tax=Apiospora phragmitis TaxID=2905665 RepID=A0ABR1WVL7_9PEZI
MGFSPIQGVKTFLTNLKNAPDNQYTTEAAAPTSWAPGGGLKHWDTDTSLQKPEMFVQTESLPRRDAPKKKTNILDAVVRAAGSRWALGITFLLLIAWGVWGIVGGPTDTWQVILQDVSSIQAYFSATLLLPGPHAHQIFDSLQTKEGVFDRVANAVAAGVGSLYFLAIYWAGIITWIVWGAPLQFSNTWQLYVNTATALQITVTTMFLQNIRKQHDKHLEKCIENIDALDAEIEMELRLLTNDNTPNPVVASTPPTLNRLQKGIDIYAYIVGGYIGITISAAVFILWAAIGHQLEFDDNWWLIIGTYTGLIGFIDSFIMNNVDHRETELAKQHFQQLLEQDYQLFKLLDADMPSAEGSDEIANRKVPLGLRLSNKIAGVCASTYSSYVAVGSVVSLLVVASAMQWTETGQLLCNTPTMIVEGFLLIMLLQAHNFADGRRRLIHDDILRRRIAMQGCLTSSGAETPTVELPLPVYVVGGDEEKRGECAGRIRIQCLRGFEHLKKKLGREGRIMKERE